MKRTKAELRFTWTSEEIARAKGEIRNSDDADLLCAEEFARAAEAESRGCLCIVCDGPVFHGSRLGAPISVYDRKGKLDFSVHGHCAGMHWTSQRQDPKSNALLVSMHEPPRREIVQMLQKLEARNLREGKSR